MARASAQKLKILYVLQFLYQYSDEDHPVSMKQIIEFLENRGIPAERKSVYSDIEALQLYGMDIIRGGQGDRHGYYIGNRIFETAELKILVDCVQSSKFLTGKKTEGLVRKIGRLTSVHQAKQLNRQMLVPNPTKTDNESIYYTVDSIYRGILENRQIRFHYFDLNIQKRRILRQNGEYYVVSPYAMRWSHENYFLIAFDPSEKTVIPFKVDKILDIEVLDKPRDGQESIQNVDLFTSMITGPCKFTGEEIPVLMRFQSSLVGIILDYLGQDIAIIEDGADHFLVRTMMEVNPRFFAWVFSFGRSAEILAPDSVVNEMKKMIERASENYIWKTVIMQNDGHSDFS